MSDKTMRWHHLFCVVISALLTANASNAATHQYDVLIDVDASATSGCTVATAKGTASGIEQIVRATVTTTASAATVTSLQRLTCLTGTTFSAPTALAGAAYALPLGNGVGGTTAVELSLPLTAIALNADPTQATVIRLAVASRAADGSTDALLPLTALQVAAGVPAVGAVAIVPVPTLGEFGLFGLAIALAVLGAWLIRRFGTGASRGAIHALLAVGIGIGLFGLGSALAYAITKDGFTNDWVGTNPLISGNRGDALGTPAGSADLVALFAKVESAELALRVDADIRLDVPVSSNTAPTVSAGSPQTVTLPSAAGNVVVGLSGSASDDGLPNPPGALTLTWSKVSGPGTAIFANAAVASTAVTINQAGSYLLRMTASDSLLSTSSDVTITVNPFVQGNQAPAISGLPGTLTLTLPTNSATFTPTVTDDGLPNPPAGLTYAWTKVSGAAVTFSSSNTKDTTATFGAAPGVYVLRLTVSDSSLSTTSDVAVTVNAAPVAGNLAPVITNLPTALTLTLPTNSTSFAPTVTDDGLPIGSPLTYRWTQLSGSRPVFFGADINTPPSLLTTALANAARETSNRSTAAFFDFDVPGTYVLRFAASDGALSSSKDVTVTVNVAASAAPVIGAFANQTMRLGETLTMPLAGADANPRDTLTYSLPVAPSGASLTPAGSSRFVFTPTASQIGVHAVTVRVADAANQSAQASFTVTVLAINQAPKFTVASKADATSTVGANFKRNLLALDPDAGDTLTSSLLEGPSGMTVTAAGALAWPVQAIHIGTPYAKIKVVDSAGGIDVAMFKISVTPNSAPQARDDSYSVKVGSVLTVPASGVLGNDADADTGSNAGLTAAKLSDPTVGSLTAFAADGSFSYQAPATIPGTPFSVAPIWNSANSEVAGAPVLVADLNGDGYPDMVTHQQNSDIQARSGRDGSQLWTIDTTGAGDCNLLAVTNMYHRVLADIDDSGRPSYVATVQCGREPGWGDHIVAYNHLGKVKWVSPPLSKPHPDARRGTTPVPPGGFTPGGLAWARGVGVARLRAGDAPVLLMNVHVTANDGLTAYVDSSGAPRTAGCRAVTGLAADENRACRAVLIISPTDGRVLKTLVAPNPNGIRVYEPAIGALSEMPPIAFDIDGDGIVDLVSGSEVWKQDAAGNFALAWQLAKPVLDTVVADLDGDGKAEIVHCVCSTNLGSPYAASELGIFIYSHDGVLKRRIPLAGNFITQMVIADVDGDGRSDIVIGVDGIVYAFRDDGRLIWAYVVPRDVPTDPVVSPYYDINRFGSLPSAAPQVYDLDGDGINEVVFLAYGRMMILDGRTGVRKVDPFWSFESNNGLSTLRLIDMNNDGHVDILHSGSVTFNCGFTGFPPGTCASRVGPWLHSGAGSNNWMPGPKAFPNIQYRSTSIDANARVLHDTAMSRIFRTPVQQGSVGDPRLVQATKFTYQASDGSAASAPANVFIRVEPSNQPPVFTSVPPVSLWQRYAPPLPGPVTHYYNLSATDPDPGDTITFSLKSAPSWVTLDTPTRIRFENPCGGPCGWLATIIVTATDSRGASTDQIFIVNASTVSATVPNVVGTQADAAKTVLLAASLQGVVWAEAFSSQPAGTVLAQDAVAGATVAQFDDVRLTVSKGLQPVLVPSVVGLPQTVAQSRFTAVGFSVTIVRQFSSSPAGTVIAQTPGSGLSLPPGAATLTVSAGNGLALALSSNVFTADQTITLQPSAFDVNGNAIALPSLTYSIVAARVPYLGSLPTVSGTTISASASTLGAFTVIATDSVNARTASATFAVMLPKPAGKTTNGAQFAALMSTLNSFDNYAPTLRAARLANDETQMKAILAQMVNTWRALDISSLRLATPIALPVGFAPTLEYLQTIRPALQATDDDLLAQQVLRDSIDDLQAITAAFRAPGGGMLNLRNLMDQFLDRVRRIDALTMSEYGLVLNAPEMIVLTSSVIPDFYEALTDEIAVAAGLPRRSVDFPHLKRGADHPKSTLAEVTTTLAVDFMVDKIMEEAEKTYKNSKKFAADLTGQAGWAAAMSAARGTALPYLQGAEISEVVSGASLSFRSFSSPHAFMEVPMRINHPLLATVTIVGPDLVTGTKAFVKNFIGGLWETLKKGASLGRDALTNPDRFQSVDDLFDLKDQIKKGVKELVGLHGEYKLIADSLYQSPTGVDLGGCIFVGAPNCTQVLFDDGIGSVYTYAPPDGLSTLSGIPLPILIMIEDKRTGRMFFATPLFMPQTPSP